MKLEREAKQIAVETDNKNLAPPTPRIADRTPNDGPRQYVTTRAFALGLVLSGVLAWLNCWIEIVANVHFLGGIQMPFGAIFGLLLLVLFNIALRGLRKRAPAMNRVLPMFSPAELLTVYAMLLFAALLSTPGTDNFFLTVGPTLFYYSTPENGWANLFYKYVPAWFAPGWDGQAFDKEVIDALYVGGVPFNQIPWHAWTMMLMAWGVFLMMIYGLLFFTSLLFRRQWIESEALGFPLVQLPLQMVESDSGQAPPGKALWSSAAMWWGFALAAVLHFLRGMNNYYPDWPFIAGFQGGPIVFPFTEQPWSAMGSLNIELFLGAVGIAYLLTREISLSFWFFFLFQKWEMMMAQQLGFNTASLPVDTYMSRPLFIMYQSVGGWLMMAVLLIWAARSTLAHFGKEAFSSNRALEGEPFSPRFVVFGFLLSLLGLLGWSWFAGINPVIALVFFGFYWILSLVLTRLVIEGGFLFPQIPFAPLEVMTGGLLGSAAIGASNLTKMAFLQPMLFSDMRTNTLPAFLHTMKIAHELGFDRHSQRRLLGAVFAAIVLTLGLNIVISVSTLYSAGGLAGYSWFSHTGGEWTLSGTAATLKEKPSMSAFNTFWMAIGAVSVWLLTVARSRFLWFPFHPLGYIVSNGFPISRLWMSFFLGWLLKTLLMKYGGSEAYIKVRPFMIGLIFGNVTAMVLWMIFGFFKGSQIPYWPA